MSQKSAVARWWLHQLINLAPEVFNVLTPYRIALLSAMASGYVITMVWPFARNFFALEVPNGIEWLAIVLGSGLASLVLVFGPRFISWWQVPLPVENGDPAELTQVG